MLKQLSLFVLTIQNTALVIVMKLSKQSSSYINSTAVFHMEFIKLFTCIAITIFNPPEDPADDLERLIKKDSIFHSLPVVASPMSPSPPQHLDFNQLRSQLPDLNLRIIDDDFWKLGVPALLYYVQNNLLYVAIENLDSLSFQLLYQFKIITTALFSVAMLGKRLTPIKWISLLTLFIGVVFVQLNSPSDPNADLKQVEKSGNFIGILAVLFSSITSGFSGVYFERILKSSKSQSVWHRNIQLGIFSCGFATLNLFLSDYSRISTLGFFHGYNYMTWAVITNQALGGLVVAMVVKYADNILKGFATSASIILGGTIGVVWMGLSVNMMFVVGASLVLYAVYLYSTPELSSSDTKLKP